MPKIKVELNHEIIDGQPITFVAPCDSSETDGLRVSYPGGTKDFVFKDAHGNDLSGIGELFLSGAYVRVLVNTVNSYAYIQNADTNAYLEAQLASKRPNTWMPTAAEVGALPSAGGTMTGALTTTAITVSGTSPTITFNETDKKTSSYIVNSNCHHFRSVASDTTYYEQFRTPAPSTGLTANKTYDLLTTKSAVTVAQGGTGKTTHTSNAVLTGNGTSAVNNVATASGALYATAANGAPKFGTLPVKQGGTGATTIAAARANLKTPYIKCLWTNASIGTEFPDQTVSCPCSDYDYIMVLFTSGDSVAGLFGSTWVKTGVAAGTYAVNFSIDGGAVWAHTRYFDVWSTSVRFFKGQQMDVLNNTVYKDWNNRAVPYKIFGIKFNEEA